MANAVLNKFIDKLTKKDDSFARLSSIDYFSDITTWLETGSPSIDLNLNTFGYPPGIIEIRGKSQSGKTTLSLLALRNFQQKHPDNGIAVILSTERRDNKEYAKRLGVDVDNLLIVKCRSIEDVLNKTQKIITEGLEAFSEEKIKPKFCFVWDSLGGSLSNQEKKYLIEASKNDNEEHDKAAMAAPARAVKKLFRFLQGEVYDNDIWFIVINHSYENLKGFEEDKSYGGRAIEFHPTIRINVSKIGYEKIRDKKVIQTSRIKIIKSDFSSSLEDFDIKFILGRCLMLNDDEIEFAVEKGILNLDGKTYSFLDGKLTWSNKPQLYDLYISENKILKVLEKKIYTEIHKEVSLKHKQQNEK